MRNLHLTFVLCIVPVKSKVCISQNFVAFSEYMNFKGNLKEILIKLILWNSCTYLLLTKFLHQGEISFFSNFDQLQPVARVKYIVPLSHSLIQCCCFALPGWICSKVTSYVKWPRNYFRRWWANKFRIIIFLEHEFKNGTKLWIL